MPTFDPIEFSEHMRTELKKIEESARFGIEQLKINKFPGEVIAQATLALRHIEDARMRFGKVIQYSMDGISKFDKPLENRTCTKKNCDFVTANESGKCTPCENNS